MALPSKELPERAFDTLVAHERTRVVAPLTEWRTLSHSLKQEGLIHDFDASRTRPERDYSAESLPRRGGGWMRATGRWTMRVAAGAALVGVGVVAGRGMTFGQDIVHEIHLAMADSSDVHSTSVHVTGKSFSSQADARKTLLRAQADYQSASAFLSATDSSPRIVGEPEVYRDRLAGLDEMTTASLNALKDSPKDPLLNQYYLSTAAAREATIRQLGNALPVGTTVERF
jgi:hypothetical protein